MPEAREPALGAVPAGHPGRLVRLGLVLGLVVLAPVGAEYAVGYDTSTGHPLTLVGGLLILTPLYGAPALLIRELARRTGIRWPGILALAAAMGLIQAGVVDQSLFSSSYRDIGYWDEMLLPTLIPALGVGGYHAVSFIGGHLLWSFAIPIALVESLSPSWGRRPWLRWPGLALAVVLYLAAAALILSETLRTESDHASAAQAGGSLALAALLIGWACTFGRRRPTAPSRPTVRVPRPRLVAAAAFVAALAVNLAPETWAGVGAALVVLATSAVTVVRWSRSPAWTGAHVAVLAGAALVARAVVGFAVTPLGEVDTTAKYLHNTFFVLAAAALTLLAFVQSRRPSHQAQAAAADEFGAVSRSQHP